MGLGRVLERAGFRRLNSEAPGSMCARAVLVFICMCVYIQAFAIERGASR